MLLLLVACFQISAENWDNFYNQVDVEITPASDVRVGTELSCSAAPLREEFDEIPPVFSWQADGKEIGTGENYIVLAEDVKVGGELLCAASFSDSSGVMVTGTSFVSIENSEPEILQMQISPDDIYNDSVVSCAVEAEDKDETSLEISYSWVVEGRELGDTETLDVGEANLMPEDSLVCMVLVADEHGGSVADSISQNIGNRLPTSSEISITWSSNGSFPVLGDSLTCSASNSTDPDGGEISYAYSWTASSGISITQDTVSPEQITMEEVWTCRVAVSDGAVQHGDSKCAVRF